MNDQLAHHFSTFADDELIAACTGDSLTEEARLVALAECQKRGLVIPAPAEEVQRQPQDTGEMVLLGRYFDPIQAQIVCANLQSADIPTAITDDQLAQMNMLWGIATGGVRVFVPAHHLEEARAIIAASTNGDFALAEAPDTDNPMQPDAAPAQSAGNNNTPYVGPYTPPSTDVDTAGQTNSNTITFDEFTAYVGGTHVPIALYDFHSGKANLPGFNIWAAIFAFNWFFYRKLYFAGFIAIVADLSLPLLVRGVLPDVLGTLGFVGTFPPLPAFIALLVVMRLGFGLLGNYALYGNAVAEIKRVRAMHLTLPEHLKKIAAGGGVSILSLLAAYLLVGFLSAAIYS